MAQRQYMRKIRTGSARFEDVYRAVSEYRTKYPDKAVVYSAQKHPEMGWAALMAGGSCANIPVKDQGFLSALSQMTPQKDSEHYMLKGPDDWLIFLDKGQSPYDLTLPSGRYALHAVDGTSGSITTKKTISGTARIDTEGIFWITRK